MRNVEGSGVVCEIWIGGRLYAKSRRGGCMRNLEGEVVVRNLWAAVTGEIFRGRCVRNIKGRVCVQPRVEVLCELYR